MKLFHCAQYLLKYTGRVIKSMQMGWAGHVEHMGEMRNVYNFLVRKSEEKKNWEI